MQPKHRNEFAIAIICALTLEADAVEALFDGIYDRLGSVYGKRPGDTNAYVTGRIGHHNVVLCYMPGTGRGSAASVASSLKVSYTGVELALVVGVCGGAPYLFPFGEEEVFLGDVIISDSVVQYDFGRQHPAGFERKTGVKHTLGPPTREIRSLLAALKTRSCRLALSDEISRHLDTLQHKEPDWQRPTSDDILFHSSSAHKHRSGPPSSDCNCFNRNRPGDICLDAAETPCNRPGCEENHIVRRRKAEDSFTSVHIGTIASADTVMKSGEDRDRLVRTERVLGFEMEGAGVWDNVPCIVIKGVCHYADSHMSKNWQGYAAAVGASAARAFLSVWNPPVEEGA